MNNILFIENNTNISQKQINSVLKLNQEGATIPFIARYRKEMTGNLDEEEIESILSWSEKYNEIEKRKEFILKTIEEKGLLTETLKEKIENCFDLTKLEDYYLPYKTKKQSKSDIAKKAGLTPLAKMIMKQDNGDPIYLAGKFMSREFPTEEDCIDGAKHIIADWINENEIVREKLRDSFIQHGVISTKLIKGKDEEGEKYKELFDISQKIQYCPPHRLLAILRAENEKIIRTKIEPNVEFTFSWLERFFIKNSNDNAQIVQEAIKEAYKKMLQPSLETETKNYYKEKADEISIETFSKNLKKLLLSPPIGEKNILAIDPGFKTGCKVVCIDKSGKLVHNTTLFPHPPQNEKTKANAKILQLVEMYKIEAIAIGDGTAGRESENWIKHIRFNTDIEVFVVREDGASIYSASKIAREEFPDFDITVRGAVSIGRRLADPLAELVKIDPKSLGVGQYQHDVNQVKLKNKLDFVVESAVNQVGVNLNTASKYLLGYVSGLGPKLAESIIEYREKNGLFKSREQLKTVPRLGDKAFEQAAGFLRIKEGENILDNSAVHPENYKFVEKLAKKKKVEMKELIGNSSLLESLNYDEFKEEIGELTFKDIVKELKKPGIDPRKKAKIFEFTPGIHTIQDLKHGMEVNGIVTNVTDFGAFVNIGIKENGLIHKTELSNEYVQTPTDFISIDDQVRAKIIQIDIDRKRIALSLKK